MLSKCIIQKSATNSGDWVQEASNMANVYGNAIMTISFVDPVSFGTRTQLDELPRSRERGPLDTRGWTFQENLLSRRVLFITTRGLYWECLDDAMSELCPLGIPQQTDDFYAADNRKLRNVIFQKDTGVSIQDLRCSWRRNIVEEYSIRNLTFEEDKLVAMASITEKLASPLNDKCFLGIWKRDAVRLLLWHTAVPSPRCKKLVFPSWS